MKYGSVASGIEAATMAWHPMGWKPQWYSEIEPFPCAVLKHRYPKIPNLGDMTKIQERKEFNERPIELLVGGTPCQSFSVAGLRKGLADPRGNLALVFLSILDRKRPQWVVWENVPGVLSSWSDVSESFVPNGKGETEEGFQTNDFDTFTSGLRQLGYGIAWRVLDAQFFGVPQRRRRVFVVGYLGDWRIAAAVLFERHGLSWDPPPSRKAGQRVAPTIASRPSGGGGLGTDFDLDGGLIHVPETSPALKARDFKGPSSDGDGDGAHLIAHTLRADGFDASEDGTGRGIPLIPLQGVQSVREKKQNGMGIGESGDPMFTLTGRDQHAIAFGSKDSGLDVGEVAPTLRGGGHDKSHQNGGVPPAVVYSLMPQNSGKDFKAREVDVTQPLVGSGPSHGDQGGDVVRQPKVFDMRGNGDGTVSPTLSRSAAGDRPNDFAPMVFEPRYYSRGQGGAAGSEITGELSAEAHGSSDKAPHLLHRMAVRRLTPRECERLQGFPDDYTLVPYNKKFSADGPRYKAIGNSMAIPVMAWIGKRIVLVQKELRLK